MSRIEGVKCDACGRLDTVKLAYKLDEDLPRDGWYSLNVWPSAGVVGEELNACSEKCLVKIAKVLKHTGGTYGDTSEDSLVSFEDEI